MSFFIRNKKYPREVLKRKANGRIHKGSELREKKARIVRDDESSIASSDEELAENQQRNSPEEEDYEEETETAQEKQLRLAKKYLQEVEEEERDREEFEEGAVSRRLQEEYLEEKGKLRKIVADSYTGYGECQELRCKEHRDSITCLCISRNGKFMYSGSKDGSIVKWCLSKKNKLCAIGRRGKSKEGIKSVLCIALSTDGKFLVVGDSGSKEIKVFNGDNLEHLKNLQGHRGPVTGLVFRRDTHTLYSAAEDRSVKVWNLDEMAYVESLFGHQNPITSIDALSRERAITSGGYDGTIRIWKISEESQLIFNGPGSSIDIVKLINEENFLSGGDDGQLCVWGSLKKKPLCSVPLAHGRDESNDQPMWITSLATLLNTDLVASGSWDGFIRLWRCSESFRSLTPLFEIKIIGFINTMAFTPDGKYLIVGVGQEHKMGRWWKIPEARNRLMIIPLNQTKISQ